MQNKSALWTFTILLTLACLFQISYSWVTNKVENKASEVAQGQIDSITDNNIPVVYYANDTFEMSNGNHVENLKQIFEEEYLRSVAHEPAYPILGETYQECKKRELSMGLDLMGGMAVSLEVSIPDLVYQLSGRSNNPQFKSAFDAAQKEYTENPGSDFIQLFSDEFNTQFPGKNLASIFSIANKEKFSAKMENSEVIEKIRAEREAAMGNIEQIMNNRINKFGVSNATLQRQAGTGRILIELPGVKDKDRVRDLLQATANLEFWETYNNHEIFPVFETVNATLSKTLYPELLIEDDEAKNASDTSATEKDTTALAANVNPADTANENKDTSTALSPADTTKDTAADTTQMSEEEQKKRSPLFVYLRPAIFQETEGGPAQWIRGCKIGDCSVADTNKLNSLLYHPAVVGLWPKDLKMLWGSKPDMTNTGEETNRISLYCIKDASKKNIAALSGSVIIDARYDYNQANASEIEVVMQMDDKGSESWARLTGRYANKGAIAIVMDNYVYSAPWVNGEITGGRSSITGISSIDEAEDLANVLKSGTLPAKAQIVDEVIVGPTLGSSNIKSGIFSFILALLAVLIYMIIYYAKAGLIANVALLANIFFLIGSLASIQASLTLPGIAGIVLTLGMAVDANVLIFERIREEMRQGKSTKMAVNDGFKRALSSIIDGNLTTLLTAIVLATFGSGPILGFATTLIIGIFTSLFCAIFISRLIITEMLERKKNVNFSTKFSENIFVGATYNWLKNRKVYYVISAVIIIVGIGSLVTRGLDYGVEFTGGRTYEVRFENPADYEGIKESLSNVFVENNVKQTPEVKKIENKYKAKITTNYLFADKSSQVDSIVEAKLKEGLAKFGTFEIEGSRKVDPIISKELVRGSIFAIVFSLVIIFLYIVMRFRKWQFGLAAVLALFHDVMVVIGLFSLFYGILPFSMEVDQAFIAAILTVVGYSINDTVVVFDRVREYLRENKRGDTGGLVNNALNSTLSRTINTSMTTLIVLVAIFLFGGESIKGFSFALLVGIGVGTYSSLCIASPLVFDLAKQNLQETPASASTTKA